MKKDSLRNGGANLSLNAFASLDAAGLPAASAPSAKKTDAPKPKPGVIHLRIEKSGRSGKTVTVLFGEGVEKMTGAAREVFLKSLKNTFGCGGAVVETTLELQGDVRERATIRLKELGHMH